MPKCPNCESDMEERKPTNPFIGSVECPKCEKLLMWDKITDELRLPLKAADLPRPVDGIITLESNTVYDQVMNIGANKIEIPIEQE